MGTGGAEGYAWEAEVEPLAAFLEYDQKHWLVKEELLPDGRKKVIFKEKLSGEIIQKEV